MGSALILEDSCFRCVLHFFCVFLSSKSDLNYVIDISNNLESGFVALLYLLTSSFDKIQLIR